MTDTTAGEGGLAAQLRRRLEDLKGQFEKGRARLGQLEAEAGELRQTLTRIAGAIQVLEEELGRHDGGPGEPSAQP
jgi:predicted nuclease with TOPRIM domain